MYINIRSLRNKIEEITILTAIHQPDILVLTETWLYQQESDNIKILNYSAYHSCRETRGGGVSIFIQKKYEANIILESNQNNNNILIIYINTLKVHMGAIYKQPSSCIKSFLEKLDQTILPIRNAILIGDFNLNLLETSKQSSEYKEILSSHGFIILNKINENGATRIDMTTGKKSIIDHLLTNLDVSANLLLTDHVISDHKIMEIGLNLPVKFKTKKQSYTSKIVDYVQATTNLKDSLNTLDNENPTFEVLTEVIQQEIQKATKVKIRKYTMNVAEGWFTKDIATKIKQRDKFYKLSKRFPLNAIHKSRLLTSQKDVSNLVKYNKKQHLEKQLEKATGSPKHQWT